MSSTASDPAAAPAQSPEPGGGGGLRAGALRAGDVVVLCLARPATAIGYQRLNAWQPSAGATYSWVGRALNPHAGFFSGWIMLMYYCVGTTSLTVPLGTYMLTFFSNAAA